MEKLLTKGLESSPSSKKTLCNDVTPSRGKKTMAVDVTPANDKKRTRNLHSSPAASTPQSSRKPQMPATSIEGCGHAKDPFRIQLRRFPNVNDCMHCLHDSCCCQWIATQLDKIYKNLNTKRVVETPGHRSMCAKSILPVFVSRLVDILRISPDETFYDLGCGNGSVLFQVAYMTGAKCIGIELSERNAELARQAWTAIKPILETKAGRPMPEVTILTGDLSELIAQDSFVAAPCAIWTANLLMPKALTHYMSERFRQLPVGSRIVCFDDLYPHQREVAATRDPDAFKKFTMVDYVWQEMSVEWTAQTGRFYYHRRK